MHGRDGGRRRWPWVGLLTLLVFAVFAEVLLSPTPLFLRDLGLWHYPVLASARAASADGGDALPLWTSGLGCGRPLLANSAYALLAPANVVYALVAFPRAFNLFIVFHLAVAGFGMLALAWRIGLEGAAAWTAAVAFMLGGYVMSCGCQYPMVSSVAWSPIVIAAALWMAEDPRPGRVTVLAAAVGIQLIGGQPEPAIMAVAVALAWSVSTAARRGRLRVAARVVAAGIGGAMLAAPQLLSAGAFAAETTRALGLTSKVVLYWSLHPLRLPELLLPPAATWLQAGTPLDPLIDGGMPLFNSLYLGASVVLVAVAGTLLPSRFVGPSGERQRLSTGVLWATAVLGVVIALGRYLPGAASLVDLSSGLVPFRYPVKALMLTALTIPLLAGRGVERLTALAPVRLRGALAMLAAAVAVADLSLAHGRMMPVAEETPGSVRPPLAVLLERYSHELGAADGQWRVYHHRLPRGGPGPALPRGEIVNASTFFAWQQRMLVPRTALPVGIDHAFEPSVEILDPLAMHALAAGMHRAAPAVLAQGLGAAGVLWMISPFHDLERASDGTLVRVGSLGPELGLPPGSGWLYRITTYRPRVRLETAFEVASGVGAAAVVERLGGGAGLVLGRNPGFVSDDGAAFAGTVEIDADRGGRLSLTADCRRPAILVVSDLLLPGWRACVDGRPVAMIRANAAFRALSLDAGLHSVEMTYRPPGFVPGCGVAALALLAMTVVWSKLLLSRSARG